MSVKKSSSKAAGTKKAPKNFPLANLASDELAQAVAEEPSVKKAGTSGDVVGKRLGKNLGKNLGKSNGGVAVNELSGSGVAGNGGAWQDSFAELQPYATALLQIFFC